MFIDIHELELRPAEFDREFPPGAIDLGPDATQSTPLHVKGHAELLTEHRGGRMKSIEDIRVVADFSTKLQMSCARCLAPVTREVKRDFDLIYRPQGVDGGREEISVTQAEAEIGYYTGDGLELEDVLREQLVLAVPLKAVCREDCKGLCPYCGKDLNEGSCNCKPQAADLRWDALKNLKI